MGRWTVGLQSSAWVWTSSGRRSSATAPAAGGTTLIGPSLCTPAPAHGDHRQRHGSCPPIALLHDEPTVILMRALSLSSPSTSTLACHDCSTRCLADRRPRRSTSSPACLPARCFRVLLASCQLQSCGMIMEIRWLAFTRMPFYRSFACKRWHSVFGRWKGDSSSPVRIENRDGHCKGIHHRAARARAANLHRRLSTLPVSFSFPTTRILVDPSANHFTRLRKSSFLAQTIPPSRLIPTAAG
ncbi:uncharacterized protein IWZ02DRAFT_262960 [Phyllosticta citriasiana]|uniref:uncharacterized protein n=1 Tax=Phyllosticta citriasiana TaxID=595635 RepID=UPI0030FD2452